MYMMFFCCNRMQLWTEVEDFTIKQLREINDVDYCPFCGRKLSTL